jgi:hypothetical protein
MWNFILLFYNGGVMKIEKEIIDAFFFILIFIIVIPTALITIIGIAKDKIKRKILKKHRIKQS